jgi:hypothetical protein
VDAEEAARAVAVAVAVAAGVTRAAKAGAAPARARRPRERAADRIVRRRGGGERAVSCRVGDGAVCAIAIGVAQILIM